MNVLLIGGTRHVGHHLATAMAQRGHRVTTFNRGRTPDELGASIERLHGDRTAPGQLGRATRGRTFDAVVDTIAMRGSDTLDAIEALEGRVGHYIHFSTGQVYLVREACPVPAREDDYAGPLRAAPAADSWEAGEHRYGIEKRECEDALQQAWETRRFPATRLRLPMIHGPRDPYGRIPAYLLRFDDGGPILLPEEAGPPLKHVDQADVVAAVVRLLETGSAKGRALNLAQDEAWTIDSFLDRIAAIDGSCPPEVVRRPLEELTAAGLFPACSPFSNPWMSVLDASLAKDEFGLGFGAFEDVLPGLVEAFRAGRAPRPATYASQRSREIELAARPDRGNPNRERSVSGPSL